MEKTVYSLCFMCSVRCPIKVTVKDGQVTLIEGNPKVAGIEGSLCPRGSAGISLLYDPQRVQSPLIRTGERGAGQWRKASWDEALDYIADKLKPIIKKHGGQSVALTERTNLATHVSKTFHEGHRLAQPLHPRRLVQRSVNTACRWLFGLTDAQVGMRVQDHPAHRACTAATCSKPSPCGGQQPHGGLAAGAKLTYIDPRVSRHRHQGQPLLDDPARRPTWR